MRILGSFFDIEQKKQKILELEDTMSESDFWNDGDKARQISQDVANLKDLVSKFDKLHREVSDSIDVATSAYNDGDSSLEKDLNASIKHIDEELNQFELIVFLSEKYDKASALLTFHAGAGGEDAQDWCEMLLSMYVKFAEKRGWKSEIVHVSRGDGAGIKSATLEVSGSYAYGYLRHESGVHRLVRLSPFDADHARHTSFAYVEVLPEIEHPETVVNEKDVRMDTFLSGGPGGQSVQTTYSAVRLVHEPTGITVSVQSERSQLQNRERAMKILISRLEQYNNAELEEEKKRLRGELTENAWGSQIRSYVLHPYKMVKDHRTKYEEQDVEEVLDGNLDGFIENNLRELGEMERVEKG